MKKIYDKAEAFRVNFNANEQVSAACSIEGSYTSKFDMGDLGVYCSTDGADMYTAADGSLGGYCAVEEDGSSVQGNMYELIQYAS